MPSLSGANVRNYFTTHPNVVCKIMNLATKYLMDGNKGCLTINKRYFAANLWSEF